MSLQPASSDFASGMRRLRILTFVDHYLPGYKFGGPLRTIANMVEQLSDEFDFRVVTWDRDLGDSAPYEHVRPGEWHRVGRADVMYVRPSPWAVSAIRRLLRDTAHDVLYLNSFFSPLMTALPLALRRFGIAGRAPAVLAPRGEFSPSALSLRAPLKRLFMQVARQSGIYRNLTWQASSGEEAVHIRETLGKLAGRVVIAADLLPTLSPVATVETPRAEGSSPALRVVFLSRIAPMKNLDFLLRALAGARCKIELSIVGPREDAIYWARCEEHVRELPPHVRVTVGGGVPNEGVASVLSRHDLFAFPTRGENFGHVIFEALSVGTPVMVSDRTPWTPDDAGALAVLPLDEERWTVAIERWSALDHAQRMALRRAARALAERRRAESDSLAQNRALFSGAAVGRPSG